MSMAGVRLGGGPEYQLPSQETLVLAKAAVMASVSSPLTMMPRFGAFEALAAGAALAGLGAVAGVVEALTTGVVLGVDATTGAADTVSGVSATAGVDDVELGLAPIGASVIAESTVGANVLEAASVGEAVMEMTGEEVPAWVGTGA